MRNHVPILAVALSLLLSSACGLPLADIRSAAEAGDVERAVRLAAGELEGLQSAARGTLERLASGSDGRLALISALDLAPPGAADLLESWAAAESSVDDATRTYARARLSELDGGAWRAELTAARASSDPRVRAHALRGLLPFGLPPSELVDALDDESPAVAAVAARGLVAASRAAEGLPESIRQRIVAVLPEVAGSDAAGALLGVLDPGDPEELAALVGMLVGSDTSLRIAAARTLGRLADPRAVPEVAALLDADPTPAGLALALEAGRNGLAELRDAYVARIFASVPSDAPLRTGALLGLEDGDAARELWRAAREEGGPAERVAACERLLAAGQQQEACRDALRELAANGTPPAAALSAAEILFEDGDPPASGWLRSFAVQGDTATRRRIMSGAAARRYDAGLLGIGLADPDPDVSAAASVAALRVPDPTARPGVAP
jgi:hypothetical protein